VKIYVAGKWEERERVREVMDTLRTRGHEITFDWTYSEQFSKHQAELDLQGVEAADWLVFLAEKPLAYKGAYVELGMAIALGTPVALIGNGIDECIFTQLPCIYRMTLDDGILQADAAIRA
jgi:nucleoside 2-deoxyribosyltransferase